MCGKTCFTACFTTVLLGLLAAVGPARAVAGPAGATSCDAPAAAGRPEYHLRPSARGEWAADNPAQSFTLVVGRGGVLVSGKGLTAAGLDRAWRIGLVLDSEGPPGASRAAGEPAIGIEGSRADLRRGSLSEWYVNGPKGLEHGLLIPVDPEQPHDVLEYDLDGTLTPKSHAGGRAVAFVDATGVTRLEHRDLRARDADGRDVDIGWERVESQAGPPGRLRLVVESGDRRGPILVLGRFTAAKAESGAAPAPEAPAAADVTPLAAPSNDTCAGAEVVPPAGPFPWLSSVHDLTDATVAGDPPFPSCQPKVSRSVWFRFTPAASGAYSFSLCADGAPGATVEDTVLAIYEESGGCAGFAELIDGCDDDGCAVQDLQSVVAGVDLAGGVTYDVVVWEYGTSPPAPGAGAVQRRVQQQPPPGPAPANDRCSDAEVIPGAGPFPYLTAVTPDITGADTSGDPPPPTCQPNVSRSIWYAFTPASAGRYSFSLCADAPTGTTVGDTVMAIYAGGCASPAQISGACADDSCAAEATQSAISGVFLAAGTTYRIVVWQYGLARPAEGQTAVQVRVTRDLAPPNDTCAAAAPLSLGLPVAGTTAWAADDTRLPAGTPCFAGIGQVASTAAGGDVAYAFQAPLAGRYSFRVAGFALLKNVVLYVASDCPSGPAPGTVAGCLGAANRNAGYPAEEVRCLALASGQRVYVYVDEHAASTGSPFTLEVTPCLEEGAANDDPGSAGAAACGLDGSIDPPGDVDFFALPAHNEGSRAFVIVDGAAAASTDFDLRLTTATDTLEYDDLENDTPYGTVAPNVAGTPLPAAPVSARVSHYNPLAASEPYRLYAAVQPAPASAVAETEPNDTPASANVAPAHYFSGALSSPADVDHFAFTAAAGQVILLGLDLDPARTGTPWNGALALLDAAGAVLVAVNEGGSGSGTSPGTGSLAAKTPYSPAEAIAWRTPRPGTFVARVSYVSGTPGDYLLSIALDCRVGPAAADGDGDGAPDATDCAPEDPAAWAVPGEATDLMLAGPPSATSLAWAAPASPGGRTLLYDVLRSAAKDDFTSPACVARDGAAATAADGALPVQVFYYLVRAKNACGGNVGARSDGTPRIAGACP
jgi:hypothetical protein